MSIIEITPENIEQFGICGYKDKKRAGYPEKLDWFRQEYENGLRIKMYISEKDGAQGMIETLPSEYAWRPVVAKNYLFIQCLYVGFKKQYKKQGIATGLIKKVIDEAKRLNKNGVAVVTRKGSFMAKKDVFIKNGFDLIDQAPSDFELLSYQLIDNSKPPQFKKDWQEKLTKFSQGLYIFRADQCPYTVKNVNEMIKTAKEFSLQPQLIELKTAQDAQELPCGFGTFCIILNGKVVAEHPISNTRFKNILDKQLKK